MDHKEFISNIKPFIYEKLDIDTLKRFLIHLNKCKECREELEIIYLVEKTLVDVDDENSSYNFDAMLKEFIQKNEEKVYGYIQRRFFSRALYIASAVITIFTGLFFFAGFFCNH